MLCSWCERDLDRYIGATLPAARMAAVKRHLDRCDACAALLEEVRVVDALLATTQTPELPPNFTFAVMAEARAIQAPKRSGWQRTAVLAGAYTVMAWIVALASYSQIAALVERLTAPQGPAAHVLSSFSRPLHVGTMSPALATASALLVAVDALLVGALYWRVRNGRAGYAAVPEERH